MGDSPQQWAGPGRPWWREGSVGILIVLVIAAYFVRLGDLTLRGEEPTRVQIAIEMFDRGDWVVPREQGEPLLSRPPLQNWLIGACYLAFGSKEPWVVRLPSVLAVLVMVLLVYGYARTFLSSTGALAAGASFATFGAMFTLGYEAETEAVFITLVGASLLLWHWGEVQGWPEVRTWVLSYACVGLAILCKGPQPPVYFLGPVMVYLVLTGQWRRLVGRPHLIGALVGALIVVAWMVPCIVRTSWPETWQMLMNDSTGRMKGWKPAEVAIHMLHFPLEFLGCTMPWSLLLFAAANRTVRKGLSQARPQLLFLTLCLVIAFPTCWIPPGGRTRYISPLYPCLAVLIGMIVESCARGASNGTGRSPAPWRRFATLMGYTMLALAIVVVAAAVLLPGHPDFALWAEPLPVALAYAALGIGLAAATFWGRNTASQPETRTRVVVLALACFMVLTCTGILMNIRLRRSEDQVTAMAWLKEQLPPQPRLVSFGHVDSLFAYYYKAPIEPVPFPKKAADLPLDKEYFCFHSTEGSRPTFPFSWQEVGVVPMDRYHHGTPQYAMVVGRRFR